MFIRWKTRFLWWFEENQVYCSSPANARCVLLSAPPGSGRGPDDRDQQQIHFDWSDVINCTILCNSTLSVVMLIILKETQDVIERQPNRTKPERCVCG